MGEVPLEGAERAIFTLSVGFAASSPKVGAKGEKNCDRWGFPHKYKKACRLFPDGKPLFAIF